MVTEQTPIQFLNKGISSKLLLTKVVLLLQEKGYKVGNVDATIVAQAPKRAPYIDDMKNTVAQLCNVDADAVNVKATTEEKLGFTGREEGVAAHAVCIICKEQ